MGRGFLHLKDSVGLMLRLEGITIRNCNLQQPQPFHTYYLLDREVPRSPIQAREERAPERKKRLFFRTRRERSRGGGSRCCALDLWGESSTLYPPKSLLHVCCCVSSCRTADRAPTRGPPRRLWTAA
eukprot:5842011-Pyramimonas_sp.AAC.2